MDDRARWTQYKLSVISSSIGIVDCNAGGPADVAPAWFAQAINNASEPIKNDIRSMKNDIRGMKSDIRGMKNDIQDMKDDIRHVKNDIRDVRRVSSRVSCSD